MKTIEKKIIERPFRVSIYRGESHWDCHSFKKKKDALNKISEILPSYFLKKIKEKEYQYRISLTQITVDKSNKIKSKKLLEVVNN